MNNSPCAKLTTSMMPNINVRPEATSARIRPLTMPLTVWIRSCSSGRVIAGFRVGNSSRPGHYARFLSFEPGPRQVRPTRRPFARRAAKQDCRLREMEMTLRTRLTELLGIRHLVLQAPMGGTAGGRLAAAVSEAGG